MMRTFFSFFIICVALSSCISRNTDILHLNSDTKLVKPSVALVPLINKTKTDIPWDLSEEITLGVRENLLKANKLYLTTPDEIENDLIGVKDINLIENNTNLAKKFRPNDFLVLMELFEHKELPYVRQALKPVYPASGKISHAIAMMVRVKVLDIREEKPKVILREILRSNHLIPDAIGDISSHLRPWGSKHYFHSPLGLSHRRLKRDLAMRLETYILAAQHRLN